MRRIVAFNRVSADGFFSPPDGNLNWTVPDETIDNEAAAECQKAIDAGQRGTLLFGRKTYEAFESFWPHALKYADAAPDPHKPGRSSSALRTLATFINAAEKIVFSRTRKDVTWTNSRLLRTIDPREIERLKSEVGPDMLIFGSGTVTSELVRHGLIDEFRFVVGPVLLGEGRTLVHGTARHALELVESRAYPSGNVELRYARRG